MRKIKGAKENRQEDVYVFKSFLDIRFNCEIKKAMQ